MSEKNNSRFVKKRLTDRQLESFKLMYCNLEYSITMISKRFGTSKNTIDAIAEDLNISHIRKNKRSIR